MYCPMMQSYIKDKGPSLTGKNEKNSRALTRMQSILKKNLQSDYFMFNAMVSCMII